MNMREPTTMWDRPPTDKELASFNGNAPTNFEVSSAIERHSKALDRDDLTEICHEFETVILYSIKTGNAAALLEIFTKELKATVARSASLAVYCDAHVLNASGVTL